MPLKALDAGPLRALGWAPVTDFRDALAQTYAWFLEHAAKEEYRHVRAAV
jgi:GDP-L-fucose synthase